MVLLVLSPWRGLLAQCIRNRSMVYDPTSRSSRLETTMNADVGEQWRRFKEVHFFDESLGFALDVSRMGMAEGFFQSMEAPMRRSWPVSMK